MAQISSEESLPSVSFVIPTLNSEPTLEECLSSIDNQDYPSESVEVIIVDGGSTDRTVSIAVKHNCVCLSNPYVNHPKGRPIGIAVANGNLIACVDSDNVLNSDNWLRQMVRPFQDPEIVATEPLYFSSRRSDNMFTKYVSLIGGDDPIAVYLGFYDRVSRLTNKWTGCPNVSKDKTSYLEVTFPDITRTPPIGANGFVVRRDVLDMVPNDPFLHVKVFSEILAVKGGKLGKVKTGIIHLHAEDTRQFMTKKLRRIRRRRHTGNQVLGDFSRTSVCILLYSMFFGRPFADAIAGFIRKPCVAWALHPFLTYGTAIGYLIAILSPGPVSGDYERAGN